MSFTLIHYPMGEEWEKKFENLDELKEELRKHICGICLDDLTFEGKLYASLNDLLETPCGCEYGIEDEDGTPYSFE